MTLTATDVKVPYNGDGSTVSFPVTFAFWDADDVRVILTDANGDDTEWTRGTQFNLPDGDGGTETLTVITTPTDYTPQTGEKLTILSNLADTQPTALPLGGAFPSTSVEQRLDQIVRLVQQISEEVGRTAKFGVTEVSSAYGDMPALSTRKSKFLAFDANGVPVAAAGTSADLGPVSSFIETLLDDDDEETARDTLSAIGIINRDVSQAEVVNTVTETSVYSFSVPGGTLSTNKKLRLTLLGDYKNDSGADRSLTLKVKYGATTIGTITASILTSSASRRFVQITTHLGALNSASSQIANTEVLITQPEDLAGADSLNMNTGDLVHMSSPHTGVAEDSSGDLALAVTAQHSAAAADISFRCHTAHLELI